MSEADIERLAAEFAELVDSRDEALELARLVAKEIEAHAAPLRRRIAWMEEALAGHQASALLRKY